MEKPKIFISSTIKDLREEREAVKEVLYPDWGIPIYSEEFEASDEEPKDACIRKLQHCCAVILIVGFRYGSVHHMEQKSITQIEYEMAKALNIPVFVFVKHKNGEWESEESDPVYQRKHLDFKAALSRERTWVQFSATYKLQKELLKTLLEHKEKFGQFSIDDCLLSCEHYFKSSIGNNRLLTHEFPLVGCKDILERLSSFGVGSKKICILYGNTGTGKSRMMMELAKSHNENQSDIAYRFLNKGTVTIESILKKLPGKSTIIIVDDAHQRDDLDTILTFVRKYCKKTVKLILASRPLAKDKISALLVKNEFQSDEISLIDDVPKLSRDEQKNLVRQIIGNNNLYLEAVLVEKSAGSNLILTVAARLVHSKSIDLATLENNMNIRSLVYHKCYSEVKGILDRELNSSEYEGILDVISLVAPFSIKNDTFTSKLADFLNISEYRAIKTIGKLSDFGILIDRENQYFLEPEILSDLILHKTCFNSDGSLTGYPNRAFKHFFDIYPENILLNLSKLDRLVNVETSRNELLKNIWFEFKQFFFQSSDIDKTTMINWVEKIAYYQPARSLDLIRQLIYNINNIENYLRGLLKSSIPKILHKISFTLNYLEESCDLLWKCTKDKDYDTGIGTPFYLLKQIASYKPGFFIKHYGIITNCIKKWIRESISEDLQYNPIELLIPLVSKNINFNFSDGESVTFMANILPYPPFKEVRKEIISILVATSLSDNLKYSYSAQDVLLESLKDPKPLFTLKLTDESINQWEPEQMLILNSLENTYKKCSSPLIKNKIIYSITATKQYYGNYKVKEKASQILNIIHVDTKTQILKVLCYNFNGNWNDASIEKFLNNNRKKALEALLDKYKSPKEIFNVLEELLTELENVNIAPQPEAFLLDITKKNKELAQDILNEIKKQPGAIIYRYSDVIEKQVIRDKERLRQTVLQKLQSPNKNSFISIACTYKDGTMDSVLSVDDLSILSEVLEFNDLNVKVNAIDALIRFKDKFPTQLLDLIINLRDQVFTEHPNFVPNIIFKLLEETYGINPIYLSRDRCQKLLAKCLLVPEIDENMFYITSFYKTVSKKHPDLLLNHILERIKLYSLQAHNDFRPLNEYIVKVILENADQSNLQYHLTKVRNLVLDIEGTPYVYEYISDLYTTLVEHDFNKYEYILDEWLRSEKAEKVVAVAKLLCTPNFKLLTTGRDMASRILEISDTLGKDCADEVSSLLMRSTLNSLGDQSFTSTIKMIASSFIPGTPSYKFYKEVYDLSTEMYYP